MYERKTNQSNLLTVRLILGCALWSVKYGSQNCIAHRWSYIIYCTVNVTIFKNVSSRVYGNLCGPQEILGVPPGPC